MNIKDIPFILPNFQTLSYLRGMINQIQYYYPENEIHIVDNGSSYAQLFQFYDIIDEGKFGAVSVWRYKENDFINNLNHFLQKVAQFTPYYVLTDCDLQINPATPPNFLEIFKTAIDVYGFHHAGFGLIVDDIPPWNPKAGWIQGDENALLGSPIAIEHEGVFYKGFRAALDTSFCLFKRENGGWKAPMSGEDWGNSLRIFQAFHLPWYLHKDYLNDEMKNYFATCKGRDNSLPSAGRNHYRPE